MVFNVLEGHWLVGAGSLNSAKSIVKKGFRVFLVWGRCLLC